MSQHEPAQPTPSAAGKTERGADEGRQATAGLLLPCACCLKACYSHVPAPATATCQLPAGLLLPRASCLQVCYSHVPAACRPATAMLWARAGGQHGSSGPSPPPMPLLCWHVGGAYHHHHHQRHHQARPENQDKMSRAEQSRAALASLAPPLAVCLKQLLDEIRAAGRREVKQCVQHRGPVRPRSGQRDHADGCSSRLAAARSSSCMPDLGRP